MAWFARNHRPLPWKGEKDPYLIWLSEIILQQTRAEQGLPYFEKFKQKYPTVKDLADAPEDVVMKLWEGLGYYARARNLHLTAKYISNELGGNFPSNYEDILNLKGVGPYTAAAIASFAFDLPHAVVDGNVFRVLARFFDIEKPIDSTEGKKLFSKLAHELMDTSHPGNYNQAIMDFGATQCVPINPKCGGCLLSEHCEALKIGKIEHLPVKSKRNEKKVRYFNYLIINRKEEVLIKKRTGKDIWRNLYEFPLFESMEFLDDFETIKKSAFFKACVGKAKFEIIKVSKPFKQILTHQKIIALFWEIEIGDEKPFHDKKHLRIERKNLSKFAFSKVIDLYLRDKSLTLELF